MSIGPGPGGQSGPVANSDSVNGVNLERERERCEELVGRLSKANKDLSEFNQRETEMRAKIGEKDKEVALIRHDLKVNQTEVDHLNLIFIVSLFLVVIHFSNFSGAATQS